MNQTQLTDARWQAIATNDRHADGTFLYGVSTTGIFCRPSCASRVPNRENVVIFFTGDSAVTAGYRPCKRCDPLNTRVTEEMLVEEIDYYLHKNFMHHVTLAKISDDLHISASYARQLFKRKTGTPPIARLKQIRLYESKQLLVNTNYPISVIAKMVGYRNANIFATSFKKHYQTTPHTYRQTQKK